MDQLKFESLSEEIWEEITRKLWDLSITNNIKQLKVLRMIKDFSSLENLLKLKEVIPNTVIVFDFKYEKTDSRDRSWKFKMNRKAVTCVFKGSEWNFGQIKNWDVDFWYFSDIKLTKNSSYVVFKINRFFWSNLVIKERSWVDDWRNPFIEELKKNTQTNDDFFIITDLNNLIIHSPLGKIKNYSSILNYFKHIIIRISLYDLRNKKSIEKINNLPKQYHYELKAYYEKGTKYDSLDLIDSRFENLSMKYFGYPYEIKIKRPKSTSNELVSELAITTINRINRQMIKTDSEFLKQFLYD